MTVAVTGASGRLGRRIAHELLQRLDRRSVVLLSREPARLALLAAGGAQVRAADFARPHTLLAAFEGVSRMVLVSVDAVGSRTPRHRAAIEAAVAAGVEHVVYTSLLNPSTQNPAIVTHEHAETEALLRGSGMAWTMLRNGIYAEHQLGLLQPALATGTLVDNRGDGRTAFVTRDDCAAVAAAVLASGEHGGAVYDVSGPELVGSADLADRLSLERRALDDETFADHLRATTTMDAQRVAITVSLGRAIREGWMARRSSAVRDLTGRDPQPWDAVLAGSAGD
jgi:NAD(P)H dehydrogenase (quinone)